MANATDYLEDKIINDLLRTGTKYLALFSTATTDVAGSGTEVTGGSYARQVVTLGAPTPAGVTSNTNLLTFANMPTGDVVAWKVMDAASGGNAWVHGAMTTPKSYVAGEAATIQIGDLDISVF